MDQEPWYFSGEKIAALIASVITVCVAGVVVALVVGLTIRLFRIVAGI